MRIALRTSGGRGEYEVAGSHESIKVHDVFDRQIVLEMLPGVRFPTNNFVRHTQGKPRIRLLDSHGDSHAYLILAALLLLPKPKREIGATPGGKIQIYKDNFSVLSIPFDVVELEKLEMVVSPTQIRKLPVKIVEHYFFHFLFPFSSAMRRRIYILIASDLSSSEVIAKCHRCAYSSELYP